MHSKDKRFEQSDINSHSHFDIFRRTQFALHNSLARVLCALQEANHRTRGNLLQIFVCQIGRNTSFAQLLREHISLLHGESRVPSTIEVALVLLQIALQSLNRLYLV